MARPIHWALTLGLEADAGPFLEWLLRRDRQAEVVLAIRRRSGQLLLHTKSFYPEGVFRLPTGGVGMDEDIQRAAVREAHEETGLALRLSRLLGEIRYEWQVAQKTLTFTSHIFLLKEQGSTPISPDSREEITAFREVAAQELAEVASQLRGLKGHWGDWGRFRAPAHELVAQALVGAA